MEMMVGRSRRTLGVVPTVEMVSLGCVDGSLRVASRVWTPLGWICWWPRMKMSGSGV